ncbi:uncharacterized protein LOC134222960 [Armigeres subalbatus]|uniref:uncharacterized protein LOC134222960 n=1 Tax=Armigeres subalbatus TaxID=124917 RepID=UPI002ED04B2C
MRKSLCLSSSSSSNISNQLAAIGNNIHAHWLPTDDVQRGGDACRKGRATVRSDSFSDCGYIRTLLKVISGYVNKTTAAGRFQLTALATAAAAIFYFQKWDGDDEHMEDDENEDENGAQDGGRISGERFFHPEELKQLIPVFREGCGVMDWINSIDHYQQLYAWSDKSTLLYATCRLTGAVNQWFLGVRQHILSWKDFKATILLAFPDREDGADVYRKLSRCLKDTKETYDNYVFRMNAIASRQYGSIYELLDHIRYCEANQELCKRRSFPSRSISQKQQMNNPIPKKSHEESKLSGSSATSNKRSDECFNCHGTGHISINCPQPQRRPRCQICRKVGHDEQHCFKRTRNDRQAAIDESEMNQAVEARNESTAYPISKQNDLIPTTEGKFLEVNSNSMVACNVIIGGQVKAMQALADSGCPVSLIKQSCISESIKLSRASDRDLAGVNDSKIQIVGTYSTTILIDMSVYVANLTVVTDNTMKVDLIVGRRFLQDNCFRGLAFLSDDCSYDVDAMRNVFDGDVADASIFFVDANVELDIGDTVETRSLEGDVYELFNRDYLNRAKPLEALIKHCVETKLKEDRYYNATPLRLSDYERKQQNKIVQEMLSNGIIRESESPYSSRVVLTRKKSGEYRLCVNFKPLNKLVERNHFPLPIIEDQISKLQGRKYFTSLDMKNGFYHVDIAENSKKYLSFVTEEGQFEFNKLPFGYTNSPSIFARYVMKVLKEFIDSNEIVVFIDDILLSTVTVSEHFDLLSRVFRTLSDTLI